MSAVMIGRFSELLRPHILRQHFRYVCLSLHEHHNYIGLLKGICKTYKDTNTQKQRMLSNISSASSGILRRAHAASVVSLAASCRGVSSHHTNNPRTQPLTSEDLNKMSFVEEVAATPKVWSNPVGHPVWDPEDADKVKILHKPTNGIVDVLAYTAVKLCRWSFDTFSGYSFGQLTARKVITRCMFLETVAGVPGMVAGMVRHMSSLRGLRRDHGWIHTLLEEAENERMHLLTFMTLRQPGIVFRGAILITQGIVFNGLFLMYLVNPRFVHRFVGYLEEEAVRTYSHIIELIDEGKLPEFCGDKAQQVPDVAKMYWRLGEKATFRDMFSVIRADEAGHRLVNHTFADMHERKLAHGTNPFIGRQ